MIFDEKREVARLYELVEMGRNVEFSNKMINMIHQLEKKIDLNYQMQEGRIRDLERRLADAIR